MTIKKKGLGSELMIPAPKPTAPTEAVPMRNDSTKNAFSSSPSGCLNAALCYRRRDIVLNGVVNLPVASASFLLKPADGDSE